MEHKVQWDNTRPGSGGSAQVPPLQGEFPTLCGNTVDRESGGTSGIFDGLWPLLRHGCTAEPVVLSQRG